VPVASALHELRLVYGTLPAPSRYFLKDSIKKKHLANAPNKPCSHLKDTFNDLQPPNILEVLRLLTSFMQRG
jgi:hypothetical protein